MFSVNETFMSETETFDFISETRPRHFKNRSRDRLETETSRPRLHPCILGGFPLVSLHTAHKIIIDLLTYLLTYLVIGVCAGDGAGKQAN